VAVEATSAVFPSPACIARACSASRRDFHHGLLGLSRSFHGVGGGDRDTGPLSPSVRGRSWSVPARLAARSATRAQRRRSRSVCPASRVQACVPPRSTRSSRASCSSHRFRPPARTGRRGSNPGHSAWRLTPFIVLFLEDGLLMAAWPSLRSTDVNFARSRIGQPATDSQLGQPSRSSATRCWLGSPRPAATCPGVARAIRTASG